MISHDLRHTIATHTNGLTSAERLIRARDLCRKYGITSIEDQQEVARIAGIQKIGGA
jgi:hypothetical protein